MKIENIMFSLLLLLAFMLPLSESLKVIPLILFILVGIYATYKQIIVPKKDFLNIVVILMPLTILLGSYYAIDTKNTIDGTGSILTMMILFIYVRELEWNKSKIKTILIAFFLGFMSTLIWGYYDLIYQGERFLELHSVGHVNHSSIYMLLVFIISLVFLTVEYKNLNKKEVIFIGIVCLSSIVSVYITGSRATMYTSVGIIFLYGIYSLFTLDKRILIFLGSIFFVITLLFVFNIDTRMISQFQKGVFDAPRIDLFIGFFNAWLNNNLAFGIGVDNSGLINLREYYPDSMFEEMSHAHSTYITYLVERGLIGIILYLTFIIYTFSLFAKKLKIDKKDTASIISILLSIANIVISFANTTFQNENAILMLMIWGITIRSYK